MSNYCRAKVLIFLKERIRRITNILNNFGLLRKSSIGPRMKYGHERVFLMLWLQVAFILSFTWTVHSPDLIIFVYWTQVFLEYWAHNGITCYLFIYFLWYFCPYRDFLSILLFWICRVLTVSFLVKHERLNSLHLLFACGQNYLRFACHPRADATFPLSPTFFFSHR